MKMEYVGMASVYAVIYWLIFGGPANGGLSLTATAATFFLFLGLKKKTRDHLSASILLFTAAAVARRPVLELEWAAPYLFLGFAIYALEGYLEKRQGRINALPAAFFLWGAIAPSWLLGLLFVALYLGEPWAERPGLRRRLAWLTAASAVAGVLGQLLRPAAISGLFAPFEPHRLPLDAGQGVLVAAVGVPTLIGLLLYWRKLPLPHRLNPLLFALLAPWDLRLSAFFGLVATVLLAATFLRQSIDSATLRPLFKHAEWHFFWWVLAVAIWAVVR
ncbi:MAG: hypothetical protein D6696_17525 [Acidobacteria bacterium]|nr:MAG: hypothetical protein D6696_17525 [Acidobacteriota bacterium]